MCEANLYLLDKKGKESLVLESVNKIEPSDAGIVVENIFSQRKILRARIKEMKLVEHKILLEEI